MILCLNHRQHIQCTTVERGVMIHLSLLLPSLCLKAQAFTPMPNVRRRSTGLLMSVPTPVDTLTSGLASICRLPGGVSVIQTDNDRTSTPQLKALYDVENSRDCRAVREMITEVDLVVGTVIPAANNSRVFTEPGYKYALPKGAVIPRLEVVDSNGKEWTFSGSDQICSYFEDVFLLPTAAEEDIKDQAIKILREMGNYLAVLLRIGRGMEVSPAAIGKEVPRPERPLVLYSYEGNQFCRLVREVLTELDIPYELRSAGKGSLRRAELAEVSGGLTQCPYLLDPNTGTRMPESKDIIRYLYKNYALWTPPSELLQWVSDTILPLAQPIFSVLTPLQAGSKRENTAEYEREISMARADIEAEILSNPVVIYTYGLSPFSSEAKAVLDNLDIKYKEISLGQEWIPGLIKEGGSQTRAALLEMTGQSSLPHVFVEGKSIGGLYTGTPGLLPALKNGELKTMVLSARK